MFTSAMLEGMIFRNELPHQPLNAQQKNLSVGCQFIFPEF